LSESDVSSYDDPKAWKDKEYYSVFPEQRPEAVEEDEEEDDDASGNNNGSGGGNGGASDNDGGGDRGDEVVPLAKRHKK
jgi:hypothetical protein